MRVPRDEPGAMVGRPDALHTDLLQSYAEVALPQFRPSMTDPFSLVKVMQGCRLVLSRVPLDELPKGIQFVSRAPAMAGYRPRQSPRFGGPRGLNRGDGKCHGAVGAREGFHAHDTSSICHTCPTCRKPVISMTDQNLTLRDNHDRSTDKSAGHDTYDRFSTLLHNVSMTDDSFVGIDLSNARLCKSHQWWEISNRSWIGDSR